MTLSIIVPVYNVEKYLSRCVNSLLDQGDFQDYEIILVDDGSTDGSGKMCDEYAARHDRVRVLHKPNGGLSSARNSAIKVAAGDYLLFVDSDDYIRSDCLSDLLSFAAKTDSDVVSFQFSYVHGGYNIYENNRLIRIGNEIISGDEWMFRNLKDNKMIMAVWKNLYKRSLIVENHLFFRESFYHEDEEWTPRVLHCAQRLTQYDKSIYGYFIRNSSITNDPRKNRKAALDLIDNCAKIKEFCATIDRPELRDLLEDNTVTLLLSAFYKGALTDKKSEIAQILSGLYIGRKNVMKVRLFLHNPGTYLRINRFSKACGRFVCKIKSIAPFLKRCFDYAELKIKKKIRIAVICKKQRKLLNNHSFSIISSNCNGGVMTSELGERFRTPTVNLFMDAADFIKLCQNLKHYMTYDVTEVENNFYPYPVGKIGDVTLYFMHYHTYEEAREKWNERKKRINYDDLFFMFAEKDGCTEDDLREFENLPYQNKVVFTKKEYPQFSYAVNAGEVNGEAPIMTDFVKLYHRRYDRCFDYVTWLNGTL